MRTPIAPTEVRYIKLGDGGRWAKSALEEGYVAFGYHSIPHDVCEAKDWDEVRRLLDDRKSEGAKTAGVNEVMAFYEMGEDCLWVTFADGHLWWCFAEKEIVWLGGFDDGEPSRIRPTVDGWRNTDIHGKPLKIANLSSNLTQTANFRATICTVGAQDYLLRKINGVTEPVVIRAAETRAEMIKVATDMIRGLH